MTSETVAYTGRIKYGAENARAYQRRKPSKHQAEMRLVDRAFVLIPRGHSVLDAPCGGGRVSLHLARKGYRMSAADLSDSMIEIARENFLKEKVEVPVEKQDVERLTYADRSFDTVVSFRLFHHFPTPDIRERVVRELCRVAREYVVLSYFSPLSVTTIKRRLQKALQGKPVKKFATSLAEVEGYFNHAGFRLVKDFAQTPLVHTLHLAVFQRADANNP
ncbi:MAG TPA: class I SAM-dependent methyltransferase [Methylomirabilota bacterium]|nr:class I SAM-dependent methyltransferase [Methylomirabilota bacterium]